MTTPNVSPAIVEYQLAECKRRCAELEADSRILDWIVDSCVTTGGGNGFHLIVFVPVDCEDVRTAISKVLAAKEPKL